MKDIKKSEPFRFGFSFAHSCEDIGFKAFEQLLRDLDKACRLLGLLAVRIMQNNLLTARMLGEDLGDLTIVAAVGEVNPELFLAEFRLGNPVGDELEFFVSLVDLASYEVEIPRLKLASEMPVELWEEGDVKVLLCVAHA